MMADGHLLLMVIEFIWHALTSYYATPEGQAELTAIEEMLGIIENPSGSTAGTTTPPSTSSPSATSARK